MNKNLIDAANGSILCDLNLCNCRLVDLLAERIREGVTISIKSGYVVGVDDGLEAVSSVDLGGMYLAPGLIDAHVHIESSMLTPAEYARVVLPRGTTSVVADPHEIVNVQGYDGMRYMLAASAGVPLDIYFTVPSCVPATNFDTSGASFYASDMYPFIREPRVLGLGEVMNYPGVLGKDPNLLDKIALFAEAGKAVDGHAPGLRGAALSAYIAAGIGSDHECTTPEEAIEKLAKGMFIFMREGSTTKDLRNLLPAVTPGRISRFCICSDDRHANDLVDEGHMDHAMRLLLAGGVGPVDAFRIASRNPAQWFGLRTQGLVAPGYRADFVIFDSFQDFRVRQVYKRGALVAKDGELLVPIERPQVPTRDSVNIKWLTAEDFRIPDRGKKVRVIETRQESVITGQLILEPKVEAGLCVPDPDRDIVKIFVLERHTGSGNIGKGFIKGLGLKRGAIGCTVSHDSHNMIVAGADDASIFRAARHLNKIKGGMVFALDGEVVLDMPLPVAGLMSDRDAAFVIERQRRFEEIFRAEGLQATSPLMTLSFMALPVIPALKITDRGLVDVERFEAVDLYVD